MYHNKYTTNILCAVHTRENSVQTYKKAIIFFLELIKKARNKILQMVGNKHSICEGI